MTPPKTIFVHGRAIMSAAQVFSLADAVRESTCDLTSEVDVRMGTGRLLEAKVRDGETLLSQVAIEPTGDSRRIEAL